MSEQERPERPERPEKQEKPQKPIVRRKTATHVVIPPVVIPQPPIVLQSRSKNNRANKDKAAQKNTINEDIIPVESLGLPPKVVEDNNIITLMEDAKKKPGRPKKVIANVPIEILGIVPQPSKPENIVEMVYHDPKIFKKLFGQYKAYITNVINFTFQPHQVSIVTNDHKKVTTAYTTIDGNKLNRYYCKETVKIGVKRETIEKLFRNLNKNHYKVTFFLKEDYRSVLYLIIKNYEMGNEKQYEVEVIQNFHDVNVIEEHTDANYPLKFQFPSKYFKDLIADISNLSEIFCVQKNGNKPLQVVYEQVNKVNLNDIYVDSDKIKLQSQVKDNEILSVSVDINRIKPFSKSNLGDIVYISVDRMNPMCFRSDLDKVSIKRENGVIEEGFVCCIKIFIDIKRN